MSPWTGEAAALADRIAAFVEASLAGRATETFDALAGAIHRWQVAHDPVLAALVEEDGRIPAVPVGLFRDPGVGTLRGEAPVVFRTSGTTEARRGEHRLRSTALYDLGAVAWARRCVPHLPARVEALLEDPALKPDSSLSHMVAGFGPARWHVRDGQVDVASLARPWSGPAFVPCTAFALAEWLEHDPRPLPTGSVLMVTGGYKGRIRSIAAEDLVREARDRLRPSAFVTEYGMTELSSQLWGTPATGFLPPPWLRVSAVRPETGDAVAPGEIGQLRFTDLCNLDGTLSIETMDLGAIAADGSVHLHGRLSGAPARGCSLTIEEAR
ncbi:MAG: acyl-protein synthetase [Alphaproteobacteria bacterium]|nr:acyl-protein synthetase [Alphaproteobacteria bacterium]MCB9696425.1 acyl-protein synthetase [Alphaproteobacteria bacterium]